MLTVKDVEAIDVLGVELEVFGDGGSLIWTKVPDRLDEWDPVFQASGYCV